MIVKTGRSAWRINVGQLRAVEVTKIVRTVNFATWTHAFVCLDPIALTTMTAVMMSVATKGYVSRLFAKVITTAMVVGPAWLVAVFHHFSVS